jgi:hypothetical protein
MDTIDARNLPLAVLNERRRRAVNLRERGMTLREVLVQAELSVPAVMSAHLKCPPTKLHSLKCSEEAHMSESKNRD